jgi:hypothetical protein
LFTLEIDQAKIATLGIAGLSTRQYVLDTIGTA